MPHLAGKTALQTKKTALQTFAGKHKIFSKRVIFF